MTYYPVVIPTLNRYTHFKRCVESLAHNTHADKTELVIGLDYPPSKKYEKGYKQIKEYIPSIVGFKKITVFERRENYGPGRNVRELRNYAFKNNDAVISSEDDNEFSPCFLDYMNKALEKYKNDPKVYSVSGYNYPIDMSGLNQDCYFSHEFSAWGNAIWKSKYEKAMPILNDPEFIFNLLRNHSFSFFAKNKTRLFAVARNLGRRFLGDKYITYYQYDNDFLTLFPKVSMVRNWGHDGTGLHCGKSSSNSKFRFEHQQIDYRSTIGELDDIPIKEVNNPIKERLLCYKANRYSFKGKIRRALLFLLCFTYVKLH